MKDLRTTIIRLKVESSSRFLNEPLATLRAVGSADGYKDRIRVREAGDGVRG